jgi:selenium-binding protein 1
MNRKNKVQKTLVASGFLIALLVLTVSVASAAGFERWPVITLDGEDYYMAGAPDGPNGEIDVPGHYWVQAGPNKLVAKHYNTGPFGAPKWWSSDAPDGELLYIAQVIIDTWSPEKAEMYASRGYVHYHEFVHVEDGSLHPTKVGWFKHIARTSFTLDGGPAPQFSHSVSPGVDFEFIPNYSVPYDPNNHD